MAVNLFDFNSVAPISDTIVATGALTQGRCVTYAGARATAGAVVAGIAEYDAAIGDTAAIVVSAVRLPVIAGAAVTVGSAVASDATGRLVTAADDDYIVGRAVTAATGADAAFVIRLTHEGVVPAVA